MLGIKEYACLPFTAVICKLHHSSQKHTMMVSGGNWTQMEFGELFTFSALIWGKNMWNCAFLHGKI